MTKKISQTGVAVLFGVGLLVWTIQYATHFADYIAESVGYVAALTVVPILFGLIFWIGFLLVLGKEFCRFASVKGFIIMLTFLVISLAPIGYVVLVMSVDGAGF